MKNSIETTAKTVEEAVEIALRELDADRGEVEINVISRGKAGILGLGSELAKVKVNRLESQSNLVDVTTEVISKLIAMLDADVSVHLKQADNDDIGGPVFEIEGDDSGLLLGRRGETLRALQLLVRVMVGNEIGSRANLVIDVEGYNERRRESLVNLSKRVADRVIKTGRPIDLEPMSPSERRIVHITLAESGRVTTESSGSGSDRRVVIHPN